VPPRAEKDSFEILTLVPEIETAPPLPPCLLHVPLSLAPFDEIDPVTFVEDMVIFPPLPFKPLSQ